MSISAKETILLCKDNVYYITLNLYACFVLFIVLVYVCVGLPLSPIEIHSLTGAFVDFGHNIKHVANIYPSLLFKQRERVFQTQSRSTVFQTRVGFTPTIGLYVQVQP